ncbi:MAG: hypothetical protein AB7K71_02470 [Polyangiaceae bacterium]
MLVSGRSLALIGLLALSCDPLIVEAARPFPPNAGPSYVPAKAPQTKLQRAADACADREEGAPCRGREGVFSDFSICHEHVCIESRCGDGVVDRRTGEFCDGGATGGSDQCSDTCQVACASDGDCADKSGCNGAEQCIDGVCANGQRVDCDDADPQTLDVCVDDDGSCVHEPLARLDWQ